MHSGVTVMTLGYGSELHKLFIREFYFFVLVHSPYGVVKCFIGP
jgi:hypothetical protein